MNRTALIGALAVALLAAGALVALRWTARRPAPRPLPPPTQRELNDPGEDVVARAMAGLPRGDAPAADSGAGHAPQADRERWHDEIRGLELSSLPRAQRDIFLRFANAERCTCGCGYTLAGCRASDMSCEVSGPRLEALLDSVRTGRIRSARGVRDRPTGG